jgi:cell division septum initiation protein DivIVA
VSPTEALEEDLEVAARRDPRQPAEVEVLLQRVHDLVATARSMPMSASVMISRDEVLDLVEDVMARLPEELRAARWLLKEREDFLARTHREGDEILEAARAKAERMVQRTEVVKSAEHRARHIIDVAEADARRMQHECEDFCDQKLASFEIVLDRTMKMVTAGREKLAGPSLTPVEPEPEPDGDGPAFFDQDLT